MALLIQDDAGSIDDANAYIDVAFFLAYFLNLNKDLDDYDTEAVEAAIIKATSYMDTNYLMSYSGYRTTLIQGTEWPRYGAYDRNNFNVSNVIPKALKNACCEYAFIELTTDLGLTPEMPQEASGQFVKKKVEDVMGILESTEYSENMPISVKRKYPAADSFIKVLLRGGLGGVIR